MSKKRNDAARKGAGRHANEPVKYPKALADCDHTGDQWNVGAQVSTVRIANPESPDQPVDEQEVGGHVLHLVEMRCLECGQRFRFSNCPTRGNVFAHPVMLNDARDLHTMIEPDRIILTTEEARGVSNQPNRSKIVTRTPKLIH